MKRRVSLFEFMPYGAPELLEGSRPHMARALGVGSAIWIALFATTLAIVTVLPKPAPIVVPPPPGDIWTPENLDVLKPKIEPPPPPPSQPTPLRAKDGIVVPVTPEKAPPPVETKSNGSSEATGKETTGEVAPPTGGIGTVQPVEDAPPVRIWETDVMPEAITHPAPVYPEFARTAGVDGRVVVEVTIGFDGHIEDARIAKSVPMLDRAALESARRWVFTPGLVKGHPVRVRYAIPFLFVLH